MSQRVTARLIYTISIVFCFFAVVVGWSQPAAAANNLATNALNFSVKTEGMISGQTKSGIQFYSEKKDDGSFEVYIKLKLKAFKTILRPDDLVRLDAWFVKNGKPAKLTHLDVLSLSILSRQLGKVLDENIEVEDKLSRFVSFLIEFYPVDEYFDNNFAATDTSHINKRIITESSQWTDICDQIGKKLVGKYDVTNDYECYGNSQTGESSSEKSCEEKVEIGGEDCFGRCSSRCNDNDPYNPYGFFKNNRYTQECLNHDLCARATGETSMRKGPCHDEFVIAAWGYFMAPVCSPFAGTWNFSFDWDGDEPLTTTALTLHNDKTFKTGDEHTGTWGVSFSIFMKLYFSNGTIYTGVFNSSKTSISGTMVDSAGIMGTWSATKNVDTASISDQKKSSIIPISVSGHP